MLVPQTRFRADPFAMMRRLADEIDQWVPAGQAAFPPINLWHGEEGAALAAEIPGIDPDSIEITAKEDTLTIEGQRAEPELPDNAVWHRRERVFGKFVRSVRLPFRIDPDRIEARFENGILLISAGLPEEDKPRKIKVKAA